MIRLLRALLWFLLLLAVRAEAELSLSFQLDDMVGEGISAKGISLALQQQGEGPMQLIVTVEQLLLADETRKLSGVRLHCPAATISGTGYDCAEGSLTLADTPHGPQQLKLQFHYAGAEDWSLAFTDLRLASGKVHGAVSGGDGGWQGQFDADGLQLDALAGLVPGWQPPQDWNIGGTVNARLKLAGRQSQPARLSLSLRGHDIIYSDPDGLNAAEALAFDAQARLRRQGDAWQGDLTAKLSQGQIYSDPVFVEIVEPASLSTELVFSRQANTLGLGKLRLDWPGMLQVQADGRFDLGGMIMQDMVLRVRADDLAGLYPVLLQPLLLDSAMADASMAGTLDTRLSLRDGALHSLSLELSDLHVEDRQARFGIYGLDAGLHWRATGDSPTSVLSLGSGHVYQIDIGPTEASLIAQGDRLSLQAPLSVRLLDGVVTLQALQLDGLNGKGELAWQAAAQVDGLSLSLLSHKLGWPVLNGELNGRIPGLSYQERVMKLDGELAVQALGGEVSIRGLRLTDPMGSVPVFEAEADMRGLDLEALTKAFSFGRITGLLDGEIRDLQLVGWQPARFEADFYTSPGEGPRRRISQRAVDNLTELGNGFSVGLSTTFLRFFEDFAYDRIRLAVRLEGQTAELDGLAHSGGGYYLVRGAGLPRIDVVGRNRRVAWRDLVGRLKTIRFKGVQVQR